MEQDDPLHADDDVVTLRAENLALRAQNIKLRRDFFALHEQLAALKCELEGRGRAVVDAPSTTTHDEQAASASTAAGSSSCCQQATASSGGPATAAAAAPGPIPIPLHTPTSAPQPQQTPLPHPPPRAPPRHCLSRSQAERYSRHLLLPAFGVAAQERLCRGSVLVVGCGGLGSPVAMYLAAAGVGRLGLVDHDTVDVTNLHRQVLHATSRVGMHKALSGRLTCAAINPTIQIETHTSGFSPSTALPLVDSYDVVVDASDNPATRYLVSDACVVAGKPLVSAAAVGTDGQLTVYHYGEDGPCYRCLFPESPAPENCSRCGEAGVLGVVPGIMGCLQALEAVKILAGVGDVSSKKMTIFDALAGRFTTVRLRGRNPACVACGSSPAIIRASLPSYDYVLFTGQPPDDGPPEDLALIDPRVRLTPQQVARLLQLAEADETQKGATAAAAVDAIGAASCMEGDGQGEADSAGGDAGTGGSREGAQATAATAVEAGIGDGDGGGADGRKGAGGEGAGEGARRHRTLFLDVRPQTQFEVMALPGVVHVPYERLEQRLPELLAMLGVDSASALAPPPGTAAAAVKPEQAAGASSRDTHGPSADSGAASSAPAPDASNASAADATARGDGDSGDGSSAGPGTGTGSAPRVVVLCRRGNNSQRVVARLAALGVGGVTDLVGGYAAWAREVDPDMPLL